MILHMSTLNYGKINADMNDCIPFGTSQKGSRSNYVWRQECRRILSRKLGRDIRPGYCALHVCDNSEDKCVSTEHLYEGTRQDNARDAVINRRFATGERHGSRTHPGSVPRGDAHYMRKTPERIPRGSQRAWAKLNEQSVHEIRDRLSSGETGVSLARAYGVSVMLISLIKRGRIWTHVHAK